MSNESLLTRRERFLGAGTPLFRRPAHPLVQASGGDHHDDPAAPTAPMSWMERLRRVFAIDLSICADCGGRVRVIADVTRPDVIQRILEHVARQQAPPEVSAITSMATVH